MLYVIATPIGHLGDLTLRAKECLESVDYILCEDTRTSRVLLDRYHLKKPLKAFHKFNEAEAEKSVLDDLAQGKSVALISDAGTPGISDPGERLICACIERELPLTHLPGPSALIMALVLSGFSTAPFQFLGFLPKKGGEYEKGIASCLSYPGVTILYESPHRLLKLLALLPGSRRLAVARELTKKFEEVKRGPAQELLAWFEAHPPKGELVVVIDRGEERLAPPETLEEEGARLLSLGQPKGEIVKLLSQKFKLPKQQVKKCLQNLQE